MNKFINIRKLPDFKDVLIVPKRSKISNNKDVSLTKTIKFNNVTWTGTPIISSNNISDINTFNVLKKNGYITCFPKHFNKYWNNDGYPYQELQFTDNYMLSCGLNLPDYSQAIRVINNLKARYDINVKFLCVDVANGYVTDLQDTCKRLRDIYPNIILVAGNIVTPNCIYELIKESGVNIIKVGIIDTQTHLKTGIGFPQLSAIIDCAEAAHELGGYVISDGGVTNPCDIVKAFAGGADFVMSGGIFASSINETGNFKGYLQDLEHLEQTIKEINEGISSACTYVNSKNIEELYNNSQFITIN
jgi:GMP reductase